jgi:hypothetical protein
VPANASDPAATAAFLDEQTLLGVALARQQARETDEPEA